MATETNSTTWVDNIISKLSISPTGGIVIDTSDGKTTTVTITPDVILFFINNRGLLGRLGQQTFRDFLMLVQSQKNEEAFQLLLTKMNADDIIDRLNNNADSMHQVNNDHDAFILACQNFVFNVLVPAVLKVLLGLLI